MKTLSVDIGGTKISTALVDENYQLSEERYLPSPKPLNQQIFTATLQELFAHYDPDSYQAVTICTAGVVFNGELTALTPGNLGGMLNYPMIKEVQKICPGKVVHCLNDAQAATYAEYKYAKKTFGVTDVCFITVSTGVGGGFVINGELLLGSKHLAGHIGHTAVAFNGPQCPCGRVGCVEAFASGRSLEREALGWMNPLSAKEIFAEWRKGEVKATQLVEQSALAISQLIANVVVSNDIRHIAIGGSVGLADGYIDLVQQFNRKLPEHFHATIYPAHYRSAAGLIGVMAHYVDQINKVV